jgi:hypothetical protein
MVFRRLRHAIGDAKIWVTPNKLRDGGFIKVGVLPQPVGQFPTSLEEVLYISPNVVGGSALSRCVCLFNLLKGV